MEVQLDGIWYRYRALGFSRFSVLLRTENEESKPEKNEYQSGDKECPLDNVNDGHWYKKFLH
jgi:hypothetical protein